MAGFMVANNEHLIRSTLWSSQVKEALLDELFGMKYIDMITDFPDGDTINIPSIGQAEVLDYEEGQAIRYTGMDTGNFTFSIDQYKSSATFITNKMKQDSFYMNRLVSSFVPKQARAIAKQMELNVMGLGPRSQVAGSPNQINGASHRFIGSGTNGQLGPQDFAKARYALQKANVPMTNLVAIVDPSVEFTMNTQTNLVNLSNNKAWEGVVRDGISTGMRFVVNIYGFDVYVSQNLPAVGVETIGGASVNASSVANLFFSASPDVLPYVGHVRQAPKVDSEYNKDLQREEYVTTARYGFKLFRPENMVVGLSNTDQVA